VKVAWPWLVVAACGGWLYHLSGANWDKQLLPLFILIVLSDLVYAIGGPHRFSRVAPAVALAGLWLGPQGALLCLFALFVGTLILLGVHKSDGEAIEAAGRGLLPFAVSPLFLGQGSASFSQMMFALQAYFLVSLFLPPKEARFRFDLLLLIAAPGLALGLVTVAQEDPRLSILMLPLLVALSCTREDSMTLVSRLRKLMGMTQSKDDQIRFLIRSSQELLQVKEPDKLRALLEDRAADAPRPELYELFQQQGKIALRTAKQQKELTQALQLQAKQTKRLKGLIGAAQRMASTLSPLDLDKAFQQSLRQLTEPVKLEWAGVDFPQPEALNQARRDNRPVEVGEDVVYPVPGFLIRTEQRELVEILVRIYATCRQNVNALLELKDSQARLLESNQMATVGRLAAGVAHELNTPLGAISLSAEHGLLQIDRGRAEKARGNFENILEAAQMSKLTVARLRAYTRPKDKSAPATVIEPAKIIEDALGLLESRIASSEVEVEKSLDEELRVLMVSIDFYGVTNNLLVNALDSVGFEAPPRKMRVVLAREGDRAVFTVEDDGPGVPAEIQEQIFEAFFTTKDVGRGMGLGLHLCKQFVEQAGGAIEVSSSSLGGACFRVTLPSQAKALS
jgi:signal transduction histidine kinase